MRRKLAILFAGVLVAGLFAVAGPAQAEHTPSELCAAEGDDNDEVETTQEDEDEGDDNGDDGAPGLIAFGTDGENSVSICIPGLGAATASAGPAEDDNDEDEGDVEAAQEDEDEGDDNGDGFNGYIVVDGDEGNALTAISHCLDGHVGVQVVDGEPGVVASGDGSYHFPDDSDEEPEPAVCLEDPDDDDEEDEEEEG